MYIIIAYILWNVAVCLVYGIDKHKAKTNAWRIPEKTLILCAVFFGACGALCGMKLFRHKTRQTKFKLLIPLLAVLNVAIMISFGLAPESFEKLFRGLTRSFY